MTAKAEAKSKPLDEAKLLKMPAKEYMNGEQLAFFRGRLEQMREQLLENARETGVHLKEAEVGADENDRATLEEEHALELRTRDRERKMLKKIAQSLQRIDEGSYGYCEETGEPIGVARLLARPTATLSLEAQQRREKRERQFSS